MAKPIFYKKEGKKLQLGVCENLQEYYKSRNIKYGSPRTAGDAIQNKVSENFPTVANKMNIGLTNYNGQHARRAMADLSFELDGYYYIVDVKSHNRNTEFNMPNLTSVQRLSTFYRNDNNYFVVCVVEYAETPNIVVKQVSFVPIEFLSWSCLTLGALGWGQVQIANSK